MSDYCRAFYRENAQLFDRLAAREDCHGNLFAALNQIIPLDGLRVAEFGAGTGRLTRLLAAQAARVYAFDIESAMLKLAADNLRVTGMTNWRLAQADNHCPPVKDNCADLAIEGWSFAHTTAYCGTRWRESADQLHGELARILKPGGTAILIETLGLGKRQPEPPTEWLGQLYAHWQDKQGFQRMWIRTDFQFASPEEAEELLGGFFGAELAHIPIQPNQRIVPECTGIWWKRF